ncbi:MAG TPA: ATP-binding protein [Geminicoccus sp.]|uniref:ATP-binding protein n=1 Tax=Geminicoccus sp. TaxID=2024832 RepID=UPI002E36E2A2|nr:ATP-binding protein [Geminicoccus sp.]HEX2528700.1 ATP-binding protein [Geminicoccus sp.]
MRRIEIIPGASALLQSLRGLGYSPETAIADLIDNSIAAGAAAVTVDLDWNEGDSIARVLDDGRGMDDAGLVKAMCFGGEGPTGVRAQDDLGRFGLGLKTASLSQCRRLTVASRQNCEIAALAWDVDAVIESGRWDALIPDRLTPSPQLDLLLRHESGTLVQWDRMDAIGGLSGLERDAFYLRVRDIGAHLGMAFHRFLAGDARRVSITLNGRAVKAWDPFQRHHPATITMPSEPVRHGGRTFTVTPYVLPHRDRFANDAEWEASGGPGGWGERQGFYVYRGKRLLVPGGWLGLGGTRAWTRDEASRLARIAVDLPTELDADWRIDVRKSQARPPGRLRPRLTAIAGLCREKAREVFAWRGSRAKPQRRQGELEDIWISAGSAAARYRIRRNHPVVEVIAEALGTHRTLLEGLLAFLERTVPVERIWLDVAESEGAPAPVLADAEIPALATQLASLVSTMAPTDSVEVRVDQLIRHLPGDTAALKRAVLAQLGHQP